MLLSHVQLLRVQYLLLTRGACSRPRRREGHRRDQAILWEILCLGVAQGACILPPIAPRVILTPRYWSQAKGFGQYCGLFESVDIDTLCSLTNEDLVSTPTLFLC